MLVQLGRCPWQHPSTKVVQRITARNTLPDAPDHCVQLRLVLADQRRVVVHLTAAEALHLAGQLSRLAG